MTTRPSAQLRRLVIARANDCCEYCLIPQRFVASSHQVDHVIAEKHSGQTVAGNLALSCMVCNLRKGSDIASVDATTGETISLFHPREMVWPQHFVLRDCEIIGLSQIWRITSHFLRFNVPERIIEREALIQAGIQLDARVRKPR